MEAGFNVRMSVKTSIGELDILAIKGDMKLAIDVILSRPPTEMELEQVAKKAKELNAKPVLLLYGVKGGLSDRITSKAKELGVLLKRIR